MGMRIRKFKRGDRRATFVESIHMPRLKGRVNRLQLAVRRKRWSLTEALLDQGESVSAELSHEEIDADINRRIVLSTASLGLTLGGTLITPAFTLVSIPLLVYLSYDYISRGVQELIFERRVGLATVDSITVSGVLLLRMFNVTSIFYVFYSISQKLIHSTRDSAQKELIDIIGEQPRTVWVEKDGNELSVPFETLQINDVIIVQAGEMIPVDGIILNGSARVDQRMLTGESVPADKEIGQRVFASTIVQSGKLFVQVQKQGAETVASQIGSILNNTADFKSAIESRAEAFADQMAVPTLAVGGMTLAVLGPASAIAVMLAYIGYNMRIIGPISVLNYLRIATKNSLLVKDGRALELLREVDTVVFDKTGTLTEDRPQIGNIHTWHEYDVDTVLSYAASAEQKQSHPIALAIRQEAQTRNLTIPDTDNSSYQLGLGLRVEIAGLTVRVGSERFMQREQIPLSASSEEAKLAAQQMGFSLVYVAIEDKLAGAIELQPTIRPEAKAVIDALTERNLDLYIISGDQEAPTRYLAQTLGIANYFAETLPENKAQLIEQLQQEGRSVCFIGDGINDSISLKKANVSVSLQGASTIATDTAQIILMSGTLEKLPRLFEIAEQLDGNMKGNLAASVIPGVITIGGVYLFQFGVLAACVLYNVGLAAGVANAMLPTMTPDEA